MQGVLALIFLFAGGMNLALPLDVLTAQFPLPGGFVRLVGACEVLGAIGLVLPGLRRVRPGLTPLAAAGLVLIMVGATTVHGCDGPRRSGGAAAHGGRFGGVRGLRLVADDPYPFLMRMSIWGTLFRRIVGARFRWLRSPAWFQHKSKRRYHDAFHGVA